MVMKFKEKESLKPYIQLNTETKAKAENNIQENNWKVMSKNFTGNFVENSGKRKRPVTAGTAEKCVEIQSRMF